MSSNDPVPFPFPTFILMSVVFVVGLSVVGGNDQIANENLDPVIREEVSKLVLRGLTKSQADELIKLKEHPDPNFVESEYSRLTSIHNKINREEIRIRPGLKPYLYQMLDEGYNINRSPHVGMILEAFSMRDDLTHDDIERIKKEAVKILSAPRVYDPVVHEYLKGALMVMARDLNPENEALLLRALARPNDDSINLKAARILTDAGLAKALPVMEVVVERLKEENNSFMADLVQKEVERLRAKLDVAGNSNTSDFTSQVRAGDNPGPTSAPHKSKVSNGSREWLIWLAAFVALTTVIWIPLQKALGKGTE